MADSDGKEKLIHFLEEKAFFPVVRADASNYANDKREQLKDLQQRTQREIERFRGYRSADEVVVNFKRDLSSQPAKKVHQQLKDLGLPSLPDVREDFESLAGKLG
jgi:hypothetical protein